MLLLDLESLVIEWDVIEFVPILNDTQHLINVRSLGWVRGEQHPNKVSQLLPNSVIVLIWNVVVSVDDR